MGRWVALFRGINVGGRNIVPMADLRAGLAAAGFDDVKSYIQSGNVIFTADESEASRLADRVVEVVEAQRGFRPGVIVLSRADLEAAAAADPFAEVENRDKTVHFFFLGSPAASDEEALEAKAAPSERYTLIDRVFYLYAPEGLARSKLAASAERCLGVPATARNARTVTKLLALLADG